MNPALAAALAAAAMLLLACNANDDDGVISVRPEDLTPDATLSAGTPEPTRAPAATPPDGADAVEVQGIVGAIDDAAGAISITRLQGADVDTVRVEAGTRIRSAGGRSITLTDLRPSDRIIATGRIEDGALVASEITVGQVVPGADPGG
jgi:hypothetical protein